jgi:hypothetical protein
MLRRLIALMLATTFALGSAALNSGCGTVLGHAAEQPITINMVPKEPEATVMLDGKEVGKGPNTYMVRPTDDAHQFRVSTQDGRTGSGTVQREIMPGVVIADAFMLVFPILIDYFNGGLYKWKPDLNINLGKMPETQTPAMDPTPTSKPPVDEMRPCPTCSEMRPVGSAVCPHCGMK